MEYSNIIFSVEEGIATRLEGECCAQCFSTRDQKEGMKAFLEKRNPNYSGR